MKTNAGRFAFQSEQTSIFTIAPTKNKNILVLNLLSRPFSFVSTKNNVKQKIVALAMLQAIIYKGEQTNIFSTIVSNHSNTDPCPRRVQ